MKPVKKAIVEAALLVTMALVLGVIANAVNGNGITLSRNYYPKLDRYDDGGNHAASKPTSTTSGPSETVAPAVSDDGITINNDGIQSIRLKLALRWYDAPETAAGQYIWLDARKAEYYEDGHIAGAHLMNYYKVEDYLPPLMGFLQLAEKIIVYCGGGTCEDSNLLATYLIQEVYLEHEKVYVFEEGWEGWEANKLPKTVGNQP